MQTMQKTHSAFIARKLFLFVARQCKLNIWSCFLFSASYCLPASAQSNANANTLACQQEFQQASAGYRFSEATQRELPESSEPLSIGAIHITRLPIFDESNPDEDWLLFRWANAIHILTRKATVEQQLLFSSGDQADQQLLEESERLLRQQGYFYDADIRPVSLCGQQVDIEVITRDNWSLTPSLAFDRAGGENTYSVGLRDANLLGYGKLLAISDGRDTERSSTELLYQDNNLFGTRMRNSLSLVNSSDGDTRALAVDLPFFALDSRRAWALRGRDEERIDSQYFRSEEVSEVRHEIRDFEFEWGMSRGLQEGMARRWWLGLRYQEDIFKAADVLPPPANFPRDREMVYPFIALQLLEDNFVTAFNLDQIYRTEDLHLGRDLQLEIGYAARSFGSDSDRLLMRADYTDTLHYDQDSLWQHALHLEGVYNQDSDAAEDLLLSYENRYFRRQTRHRSFFARLQAVYSKNLNSHRQVVLGGANGARAFESQLQTGDRRLLLTLEERLYSDIHLWNLLRVGAAAFIDAGRMWSSTGETGTADKWLHNVGIGLRLASSRAASDRIAHLDFAFPTSNRSDPQVDDYLVSFTIKGSF